MHRTAPYVERPAFGNHLWHRGEVRWVRRLVVAALLVAPIAVVTVVAWPSDGDGPSADGQRASGSGPDGALVAGDEIDDEIGFQEIAEYRLVGEGRVRIGVRGEPPMDATLRVLDGDGDELAFNDDTVGLDPEVTVELDGEELVVQVAELGGNAGAFHLFVD